MKKILSLEQHVRIKKQSRQLQATSEEVSSKKTNEIKDQLSKKVNKMICLKTTFIIDFNKKSVI